MAVKRKRDTVREMVKRDLHAGKPWSLIREEYRSRSQIYEGWKEWSVEVDEEILAKQGEVVRLNTAVEDLNQKLQATSSEHTELLKENEGLREDVEKNRQQLAGLTQRLEALEKQVEERQTRLGELNSKIEGLASKGVTLEAVEKVRAAEFESGEDLLSWVQTARERVELKRRVEELTGEKAELEEAIKGLRKTLADLRERIKSAENRLDGLKDETAIYSTAVDVVKKLFRAGYGTKDIAHLRDGLKTMGIKGDPQASLKRLVKGLERAKSLETLRRQVKEAEGELKATRRDLDAAKAELASMRNTTVKILSEVREVALAEIGKTREKAAAEITRVFAKFEESLKRLGELQREVGKFQAHIDNTKLFIAFMYNDEALQGFPISFASRVVERVALWIAKRHPQAKSKPSESMGGLRSYEDYDLNVVATFLSQALRQLMRS